MRGSVSLKTILKFTERWDKQIVILKHKYDIKVFKEVRKAYTEIWDANNNLIENINYIIIQVPKKYGFDFNHIRFDKTSRIASGYQLIDCGDYFELVFHNTIFFTWIVDDLANLGILKVTRIALPLREFGELFPYYINFKGIWQKTYNMIVGIISFPYEIYVLKKKKEDKRPQKEE